MKKPFGCFLITILLFITSCQKNIDPIADMQNDYRNIEYQTNQIVPLLGVVLDTNNAAISGASVVRQSTGVGTATANNGVFILSVPEGSGVLVISHVGFKTLNLPYTVASPGKDLGAIHLESNP